MIKKLKSKKIIIVSIMILLTCCLMLSYATFVVTTSDYKASELLVSELTYSLAIYDENNNQVENNKIIISGNQTKIYNVEIRSINKIDSKYTLAYKKEDNITVKYSNRTSWSTEDYIKDYNSNNIKKVRIVVENTGNEEKNVEIKIFGGYRYNDYIKIDTKGYTRITEEYDEESLASSELLNEIVEYETKCESERCLYGGGSKSNYLSYSNNLYRIIGTYNINNERVTKIISENITPTTNIKEDLNNIYNSLENKDNIIYKTNKFNCNENSCEETEYSNIGLLTKYEYEVVGGENSYLNSNESYYILNGTTIETQNGSELGSLKPVLYLPSRTRVTGSGTINDPYMIKTKYILTYNVNGGNPLNPSKKEITYLGEYGDLPTPTRTGYTFIGWYTEISGGSEVKKETKVTKNEDHTIYARWKEKEVVVTYNQNGGSGVSPTSNTVTYNTKYKLPGTNPTRVGYTFAGWFTALDGGTQVTTSTTLTNASNHSLYAHWTINKYNVTVNVINGSVTTTNPLTVNHGSTATFTIKANSGYKLDGASVSCTGGSYNQAGSLTVTNVTSARTCTVTLVQAKVTFTMNSSEFPDRDNSNSSPCYIIAHKNGNSVPGTAKIDADWNGTVTYGGKIYTGCVLLNSILKYGESIESSGGTIITDTSRIFYTKGNYSGSYFERWFYNSSSYSSNQLSCSATLTCDPT